VSKNETSGLRERNKAKRRDRVLDAALDLLDRTDGSAATAEAIADAAEVSPATVYNLVGTREQLLVALLDRLVADLVGDLIAAAPADDPIAAMRSLTERAVAALVARPVAHRRVILELTAAAGAELHTRLSPATAFEVGLGQAQAAGVLLDDLDTGALAMQAYLAFNGALLRWAAGALTDAGFRTAALHGLATVLAAAAAPRHRRRLLDDLRTLGAEGLA
jgi:AcrR family transcriptional regulator